MTEKEVNERIDMKFGILLEHMDDGLKTLLENIDAMIENKVRPIVQEEHIEIKQDMAMVKAVVKETNHDIHNLQQRITRLEETFRQQIVIP